MKRTEREPVGRARRSASAKGPGGASSHLEDKAKQVHRGAQKSYSC